MDTPAFSDVSDRGGDYLDRKSGVSSANAGGGRGAGPLEIAFLALYAGWVTDRLARTVFLVLIITLHAVFLGVARM